MLTTFTAFTPLLNAGDGLDAHHFADNVRVQLGQPETLQPYMVAVQQDAFVSKHEAIHFQIAKGWLWVQRDEEPDDDPLGAFMNTNRMAWELRLVLSCAALAGCGENSYWRNGGQTEICGVYRA